MNSVSNQYFIYATSAERRRPQIPPLSSPSLLRRELLKSSSTSLHLPQKKPQKLLSRNTSKSPSPRRVTITETGHQLFSVNTTWPNGYISHSEAMVDPLLMINLLLELEDCMGRRDIRYSETERRWNRKNDDARVIPCLSKSLDCTREYWDLAFNDGILGVDEDWSIYAVVMSSARNIRWNKIMKRHQVVIGFQLVNGRSGANLFIQISNWANDRQHRSYNYCDPATSPDSTVLTEQETQLDGEEQWAPDPIFTATGIYAPTGDTTNSILLTALNEVVEYVYEDEDEDNIEDTGDSMPPAYCNKGFEHDYDDSDDYPGPSGATGCSGCTIWSDR